jgi:hypothetical protein
MSLYVYAIHCRLYVYTKFWAEALWKIYPSISENQTFVDRMLGSIWCWVKIFAFSRYALHVCECALHIIMCLYSAVDDAVVVAVVCSYVVRFVEKPLALSFFILFFHYILSILCIWYSNYYYLVPFFIVDEHTYMHTHTHT